MSVPTSTIDVTFAIKTYTIIASSSLNGSITPSGNVSVNYQTDQSFTIAADTGYNITQLLVDNVSIGTVPSDPYTYTFTSVTANHTIHAEFGNASTVTAVATVSNSSPTSGTTVTLDGSGSTPSTGLTYSWTQTSGTPTVPFYDASAVSTTFVAPVVNTATQLTFTLTVTDGQNTDSTDVLVTVQPTDPQRSRRTQRCLYHYFQRRPQYRYKNHRWFRQRADRAEVL